jgi:hypothetical protein
MIGKRTKKLAEFISSNEYGWRPGDKDVESYPVQSTQYTRSASRGRIGMKAFEACLVLYSRMI